MYRPSHLEANASGECDSGCGALLLSSYRSITSFLSQILSLSFSRSFILSFFLSLFLSLLLPLDL